MFRKMIHALLLDAYEPVSSRDLADIMGLKRTDTVASNLAALERDGKAIRVGTTVVGTNRRVAVYVAT
jgi:chromosome segregation and condensation protein ScpB